MNRSTGNGTIQYVYDATGVKLEKKVTLSTGITTITQYDNGFIYEKVGSGANVLKYFSNEEGYVRVPAPSLNLQSVMHYNPDDFEYIYQYKDHLGNVRASFIYATDIGRIPQARLVLDDNYYAFGLRHEGYGSAVGSYGEPKAQKLKYNGKELQDELNLGWYDYFARNYDPALGRWFNIDPLAETSRRFSPYTYCLNNPVYFIDPDGMEAEGSGGMDTLDTDDVDVEVDMGYGRKSVRNFSGAINFSGAEVKLNEKGAKKTMLQRFKKDENGKYLVDPYGKPDFSQKGANTLMSSVEGLDSTYKEAGNPEIRFTLTGNKDTGLADSSWIDFNKSQIKTNYRFASTFFHELRHVIQYNQPYTSLGSTRWEYWIKQYGIGYGGSGGVWEMMELDAYRFQQMMGDDSSYIVAKINEHSKNVQAMDKERTKKK